MARLRARNDIDWVRVGLGTALGTVIAAALAILSTLVARWTGLVWLVGAGFASMLVVQLIAVWIIGRSLSSRLIILLVALAPAGYLYLQLYWHFACSWDEISCSW